MLVRRNEAELRELCVSLAVQAGEKDATCILSLAEELRKRTGLPIHGLTIKDIDFIRDIATIRVFYFDVPKPKSGNGTMANREVLPQKSLG